MQERSSVWQQLAVSDDATLQTIVRINGIEYNVFSAPVISRALFQDNLSVGNCVAGSLQLDVQADSTPIPASAEVVVAKRLTDGVNVSEDLAAGTFYISRRVYDAYNRRLKLTCYDAMLKANAAFPLMDLTEEDFPMAMADAISFAATKIGVEVDSRTWNYIPTGADYMITYPLGMSVKKVLEYIGGACGGNWLISPDNKLRFVPLGEYSASSTTIVRAVLGKEEVAQSLQISRIIIRNNSGQEFSKGDFTGYALNIGPNPYATQQICDDLYDLLCGLQYQPFTISTGIYDPATEIGDSVTSGTDLHAVLCYETAVLGAVFRGDISAPHNTELEDEYPYIAPVTRLSEEVDSLSAEAAATRSTVNAIAADYLKASEAEIRYATVNLANVAAGSVKTALIDTGAVGTAQIADASITDAKVVDLSANKITAGTLSTERLEIRGSNTSIVYSINNITGALQSINTDTINGEVLTPRTITADRIVANAITANEIAASTITANEIAANSITAAKLDVSELSAITANMGTITGGLLQLGTNAVTELKNDGTGHIGAWNFDATKLYNGTYGTDGSIYLSTANMGSKTIGGRSGSDWRLTVGSNFGVTNAGAAYMTSGNVGGWAIGSTTLTAGTGTDGNTKITLTSGNNGSIAIKNDAKKVTIGNSGNIVMEDTTDASSSALGITIRHPYNNNSVLWTASILASGLTFTYKNTSSTSADRYSGYLSISNAELSIRDKDKVQRFHVGVDGHVVAKSVSTSGDVIAGAVYEGSAVADNKYITKTELNSKDARVTVSVAKGATGQYDFGSEQTYRILLTGHNSVTGFRGLYILLPNNINPVIPASNYTVSVSGTTATITNTASAGTVVGVII